MVMEVGLINNISERKKMWSNVLVVVNSSTLQTHLKCDPFHSDTAGIVCIYIPFDPTTSHPKRKSLST